MASNPLWLRVLKALGAPVPPATPLRRASGPWREGELSGLRVREVGGAALAGELGLAAAADGAPGQDALLVDLRGGRLTDLDKLWALRPHLSGLARNGRVVLVLSRPAPEAAEHAALNGAAESFARSLAKEVGRFGSTVNVVVGAPGAVVAPWILFLLSLRAAYVSGQTVEVDAAAGPVPLRAGSLRGAVAAVTGAAQGIGLAIAELLGEEGAVVVGIDRRVGPHQAPGLAALAGSTLELDVTAPDAPARLVEHVKRRHGGRLDVLVNNAGITRDRLFVHMDEAQWRSVLDVNLRAAVGLTRGVTGEVLARGGRVVCLSSISGVAGNAGQTNYAASKGGLMGFVAAEAAAMARRGGAINAVAPGFIATAMTAAMPFLVREVAQRMNALAQAGTARDVAELVAFLARPEARGVNGRTLRVCGLSLVGR